MINLLNISIIFSGLSFISYGVLCISSEKMKAEFKRFGLERQRFMTGLLELLGGAGLLIGLNFPIILAFSSGGLALLMLLGFGVRLKIKDGLVRSSPAFLFMILNSFIFKMALDAI